MSALDLTALRVIAAKHIDSAASRGAKEILTRRGAVITPLAADAIQRRGLTMRQADGPAAPCPASKTSQASPKAPAASAAAQALFRSPEAERIKAEIVTTGKKLWHRQFVDGNGGNISYRIGPNEVLCTPTLCSKYDLTPELICMVDLEGNQIAGSAARTSEIFLHLQIYKTVPEAKGVVQWVREVNDQMPDVFPGMGVQFAQLNPAAQSAIAQFLVQRDPLFFADAE